VVQWRKLESGRKKVCQNAEPQRLYRREGGKIPECKVQFGIVLSLSIQSSTSRQQQATATNSYDSVTHAANVRFGKNSHPNRTHGLVYEAGALHALYLWVARDGNEAKRAPDA
jgi:hypothetical protein